VSPDYETSNDHQRRPSAHRQPCPATTAAGRDCRAAPLDSGFCWAHDPDLEVTRAEGRARGGRNRSTVARGRARIPEELAAVVTLLETALTEVHAGLLEPGRASAMASLANAIVRARESFDVEVRLEELEQALLEAAERERVHAVATPRPPAWRIA